MLATVREVLDDAERWTAGNVEALQRTVLAAQRGGSWPALQYSSFRCSLFGMLANRVTKSASGFSREISALARVMVETRSASAPHGP
jgi:hypothetical protein